MGVIRAERSLAEQFALFAFDPSKNKPTARPPMAFSYGLAGAVVMDLVMSHGSHLVDGKVVPGPDTGDPVLDEALAYIRRDEKPRDITHWVKSLAGRSINLKAKVLDTLSQQGILAPRENRVLGFRFKRYALIDAHSREHLLSELHNALVAGTRPDPRIAAIIALAFASGLIGHIVDRTERAIAMGRALELFSDDPAARAVRIALQDYEAAAVVGALVGAGAP